jgi:aminoglycoside 6'-N-acetyltransferase
VAGARPDLTLRPLAEADVPELARIIATPEVARWWDDGAPWEEPDATLLTIVVDGEIAGLIQYDEELDPKYRHAGIDIFVDPARHNEGVGTRAIRELVRRLIEEHGHHRITIDPAAHNEQAIRAYEKAGFRRVGVMRRYERDMATGQWHDGLLMELIGAPPEDGAR